MSTFKRSSRLLQVSVVALLAGLAPVEGITRGADAHEYWLEAAPAWARPGDTILVRGFVGMGFSGEPKLYSSGRTAALLLEAGSRIDLKRLAADSSADFARVVVPDDSGLVVAFVSEFSRITLDGPGFESYLAEEGLEAVQKLRADSGTSNRSARELYRRSVKTWVAGPETAPSRLRPLGLPLELVALGDPTRAGTSVFQLLDQGQPLAGALVRAWHAPLPADADVRAFRSAARESVTPSVEIRTDSNGEAHLGKLAPGLWLIAAVHMIPSRAPDADWESTWTSLTFRRGEFVTPEGSAPASGARSRRP